MKEDTENTLLSRIESLEKTISDQNKHHGEAIDNSKEVLENHKTAHGNEIEAKFNIIETRDNRIKALELELQESNEARGNLKYDIHIMNEKIIVYEEQIFQSKTI